MPQLKPTRGICLNRNHPLSRGLVGLWLFNEGSGGQVFDLSGNRNTGTIINNPVWLPGKFGPALDFGGNGTGDYVSCGTNLALTTLSVGAWIKTSDNGQNWIFAKKGKTSGGWVAYGFLVGAYGAGAAGTLTARIQQSNIPSFIDFATTKTIHDNLWHFVCLTFDGTYGRLYIDGLLEATSNSGSAIYYDIQNGVAWIAAQESVGAVSANSEFNGSIDIPIIHNRVLSASEIAQVYREPFCMFEEAMRPKLIGGQIVNLAGSSVALSSLSATVKAMRKVGGNVVSTTDVTAILNLFRSLLYIESNWKREALFNGMTANAFKLGTTLSLGWFWVRVAGCSVLYRGSSMGEIDFVNILAVAEQDAREISPPSYISHNSGSTYFYVVRRFNDCGYQERTLAASVKVSIESNGELAEPQPNKVFDSGAELVDGNKILLVWYYCPLEQKSQPMCFNVYYDGRTGQINYENPLAIIGYKGRKFYSYQCGALEAGRYLFAIRTEDASGIENSSLARLRIQFDPTNPAAIDILSVEGV